MREMTSVTGTSVRPVPCRLPARRTRRWASPTSWPSGRGSRPPPCRCRRCRTPEFPPRRPRRDDRPRLYRYRPPSRRRPRATPLSSVFLHVTVRSCSFWSPLRTPPSALAVVSFTRAVNTGSDESAVRPDLRSYSSVRSSIVVEISFPTPPAGFATPPAGATTPPAGVATSPARSRRPAPARPCFGHPGFDPLGRDRRTNVGARSRDERSGRPIPHRSSRRTVNPTHTTPSMPRCRIPHVKIGVIRVADDRSKRPTRLPAVSSRLLGPAITVATDARPR